MVPSAPESAEPPAPARHQAALPVDSPSRAAHLSAAPFRSEPLRADPSAAVGTRAAATLPKPKTSQPKTSEPTAPGSAPLESASAHAQSGGPGTASPGSGGPATASPGSGPATMRPEPGGWSGGAEPDARRWKALAVCLVAVFMTLLDVSIVNVALPDLSTSLGASSADLQWILSGYALSFGLVLVPAGRLGDIRSRKTTFLVSVAAFVVASALCGLAQSPTFLVVARLVQGVAAGALTPQVSGLIQELFSGRERGRAFGYLGAIAGISTAIGPLLGGLLILLGGTDLGWRLVFYVNLPIGAVALVFAYRLLPDGGARQRGESGGGAFDPLGTVLLGGAVVAILLPLVEERTWGGWHKWLLLVVAAVLGLAFVGWERRVTRRGGAAAVDLTLFTKPSFAAGNVVGLVYFAGFTSVFFVWSVFLQQGHGYPAWKAGLATVPFAVAGIVTSRIAGRRAAGSQSTRLVQIGSATFCVGFALALVVLRQVTGDSVGAWMAVPLFIAGLGNGLLLPANQTSSLSEVDVRQAGVAGAVFQTSLRIGTAVGIAVVASSFYKELATTRGDFSRALQRGFAIAVLFGALTFAAALAQAALKRRSADRAGGTAHQVALGD